LDKEIQLAEEKEAIENRIKVQAEKELEAQTRLAEAQGRAAALAEQGLAGFLKAQADGREAEKNADKEETAAYNRIKAIEKKAGRQGFRLSARDKQALEDAQARAGDVQRAEIDRMREIGRAKDAADAKAAAEAELKKLQADQLTELKGIRADITKLMRVGG